MRRSQFKKQLKAKRAASRRDPQVKRGFRKMVVGSDVYQWRYYGSLVEIRTPSNGKWVVPIWQLQGFKTEEAWRKEHEDCFEECDAYMVYPKLVREYIDRMRAAT